MWSIWARIQRGFEDKALARYMQQENASYRRGFAWAMEHYWIDKWPSDYIEECATPPSPDNSAFYQGVCYAMQLVDQMAEISQALNERLEQGVTQAKEQK